eukprot:GHVL01008416.1.p1 GENE.GHVL01008416.1~~GHVL01008416.1.p1  ORF type:complete len:236 (+),score=54.78 GHVL01008416.1:89-796(+)
MMRLFGYAKKDKTPKFDVAESIKRNRETIDTLEKKQKFLEAKMAKTAEEARVKIRNNDKRGAMVLLKQKKMYENQLEGVVNSMITLTEQVTTLEGTGTQAIVVAAMAAGVEAQKAANKQMNINEIDNLVDDIQELKDQQQEIATALGGNQSIVDDEELLEELQQLETCDFESLLSGVPSVPVGAFVSSASPSNANAAASTSSAGKINPSTSPTSVQPPPGISDDDQLAALQAELA